MFEGKIIKIINHTKNFIAANSQNRILNKPAKIWTNLPVKLAKIQLMLLQK